MALPEAKVEKMSAAVTKVTAEFLPREAEDAVTFGWGSDSYPGTIIKRTAKTITFQEDRAVRTDGNGQSEAQSYTYLRNVDGKIHRAHLDSRGNYNSKTAGRCICVGKRRMYRDPSF